MTPTEQANFRKAPRRARKDITYDELDAMCERLSELPFQCENWYPTIDEIQQYIEPYIKSHFEFALWITETGSAPQTDEHAESRKYLLNLLNRTIRYI